MTNVDKIIGRLAEIKGLRAETRPRQRTQRGSAETYEVELAGSGTGRKYIIKIHSSAREAERERDLATKLAETGSDFFSAKIIGFDYTTFPEAVIYHHAETETGRVMQPLDKVVQEACRSSDRRPALLNELRIGLNAIDKAYSRHSDCRSLHLAGVSGLDRSSSPTGLADQRLGI